MKVPEFNRNSPGQMRTADWLTACLPADSSVTDIGALLISPALARSQPAGAAGAATGAQADPAGPPLDPRTAELSPAFGFRFWELAIP
jgi:hypothetical protein